MRATTITAVVLALLSGCAARPTFESHTLSKLAVPIPEKECVEKQDDKKKETKNVCSTVLREEDYGTWFVRRVRTPHGDKKWISTVEIIWCDTGNHNYEKCRVAVAWSRSSTGGLGLEEGYKPPAHMSPDLQRSGIVKWPDRHPVPGLAKPSAPSRGSADKPETESLPKNEKDPPMADDL